MIVIDGYVIAVEKNDKNYSELAKIIKNKPKDPDGKINRLKFETLEWELVELPPMPEDEEATIEDYEAALSEVGV